MDSLVEKWRNLEGFYKGFIYLIVVGLIFYSLVLLLPQSEGDPFSRGLGLGNLLSPLIWVLIGYGIYRLVKKKK